LTFRRNFFFEKIQHPVITLKSVSVLKTGTSLTTAEVSKKLTRKPVKLKLVWK